MSFVSFAAGMGWISMNGLSGGDVVWPFQGEGLSWDRPTQGVALVVTHKFQLILAGWEG
jgi:hypothetical protein